MADSDCKDTLGFLGHEDTTPKELLRCLAGVLEQIIKSEGAEGLELARGKARELLGKLEPLIAQSTTARTHLEEAVRQRPLLAVVLATAAGFMLASLRRR
jgi:ElaB/YqjD/DUF883 family membrane-anchored ribosome-binding protein